MTDGDGAQCVRYRAELEVALPSGSDAGFIRAESPGWQAHGQYIRSCSNTQ